MEALEGYGSTQIWGFSPSIDMNLQGSFVEVETVFNGKVVSCRESQNETSLIENAPLNVLLMGAGDARHVIKTVARNWKAGKRPLHFYIMEPQASLLARQMLLLNILWNPELEFGLQERAQTFCQIFGNLLVNQKVHDLIQQQATAMIRWVTDEDGPLSHVFDFSLLKYRERDDLEFVFKFWRDSNKVFDAKALWDIRSQSYLKRRYDSRENVIDWDYHMKLLAIDKPLLSIIHQSEYKKWRMHGLAFETRDSNFSHPNKTMATAQIMKHEGVGVLKWGYFSDISVGPFVSFGLDTQEKDLLKTENDRHVKASQDITFFNIQSYIHEFTKHSPFKEESAVLEEIEDPIYNSLDSVKVSFLPCDPTFLFVKKRNQFKDKFQRIFISNALAHRVGDAAFVLDPNNGKMIVETAKYMPDLSKDQIELFRKKILEMGSEHDLKVCPLSDKEHEILVLSR